MWPALTVKDHRSPTIFHHFSRPNFEPKLARADDDLIGDNTGLGHRLHSKNGIVR